MTLILRGLRASMKSGRFTSCARGARRVPWGGVSSRCPLWDQARGLRTVEQAGWVRWCARSCTAGAPATPGTNGIDGHPWRSLGCPRVHSRVHSRGFTALQSVSFPKCRRPLTRGYTPTSGLLRVELGGFEPPTFSAGFE